MASHNNQHISTDAIRYVIHHVVLPPQIPQKDDGNPSHERCLLDNIQRALQVLQDGIDDVEAKAVVASGITSIKNLRESRDDHGNVSEYQLRRVFRNLAFADTDNSVPLEIKAQNAGLLVSRCGPDITFESFELSPVNKAAMSTIGRLVRTFPGRASKLPVTVMQVDALRHSLAHTIAKMTTQAARGTQPRVKKDGQRVEEERDTTHPMMVTDWLMNYIASLGGTTSPHRISKNTREEILWNNCKYPWRRSPLWLLVRVTLQLLFTRQGDTSQSFNGIYKAFIVQVLSHILDQTREHWMHVGSETIYNVYTKLERRLRKMEGLGQLQCLESRWKAEIEKSVVKAHGLISKHWTALSKSSAANIDMTSLRSIEVAHDLDLDLPALDTFLTGVKARRPDTAVVEFKPHIEYPTFPSGDLPKISSVEGVYKTIYLVAFETWVEHHLPSWISTSLADGNTCRNLRDLIESYHYHASSAYTGLPISLSLMYLTILELWIACDKSACHNYSLLRSYRPDVPLDEFQCLVLPFKRQMERLCEVERYLQSREDAATDTNPSVFRNFGDITSFGVRYFDRSLDLQSRLTRIEQDATEKHRRKREELASLKIRYRDLMDQYNSRSCETHEVLVNDYHGYTESRHKPNCARCALKDRASALHIDIYEWPLSPTKSVAKATVFELALPEAYGNWRDATFYVIVSVLGFRNKRPVTPEYEYTLNMHHGLSHMLSPRYHGRRVVPLSSIKPHTGTHRKQKKAIPNVHWSEVCLPNALSYAYFDKTLRIYTAAGELTEDLAQKCMHRMTNANSKGLERFIYRPPSNPDGPPPNEVIASLSDCPTNFSMDEYKAFGMLSLGREIIYYNLLTQLATPTIDFSKVETHTHLLQIMWQVGVPHKDGEFRRVSHQILAKTSFGNRMLEQLEIALDRVEENWESWRACATFVTLARRILSLTQSPQIQTRSLMLLNKARLVTLNWLRRLKTRATCSTNDEQRTELHARATEIALLCSSTFDVDEDFVDHVLSQQTAISMLLQCSIIVQENHTSMQAESQDTDKAMLQSWKAMLYRIFTKLRDHLLKDNTELNDAVLTNWAAFQPMSSPSWEILSPTYEHWLHTKSGSLTVHFNLLTGELLVKGLPLARLPSEYMTHPMYVPLFQKATLEVVPSDEPGMSFSARSTYRNFQLHFGMDGQDMCLLATQPGIKLDLLPARIFGGHLPVKFVEDYVHWYDHDQDVIIFRPRDDPWSSKKADWKLIRERALWRLVNSSNVLISMSSHTARLLSGIFSSLEDSQHIHTMLDMVTRSVIVKLPRLQLDFFINPKDVRIQSRQYRGMVVDPDQTTDVLVGLHSKMVLRSMSSSQDRIVLIPSPRAYNVSAVTYTRVPGHHHMSVRINRDQVQGVYTYSLDTTLGRVLDGGDMQRKLFLAFLHVITSHCLPDPLTGYTGTESALQILKSAAVRSFEFLTTDNAELLGHIAALSPRRAFYPTHLQDMQQIVWDTALPVLSQHPHLRTYCREIIHQTEKMRLFYPNSIPDISHWRPSSAHLEARDLIRSATYRVYNFGGELFTAGKDVSYEARDAQSLSERGRRAYIAATLMMRDVPALHSKTPNLKDHLLQTHFRAASIQGDSGANNTKLEYDTGWLSDPSTVLTENWCNLHRLLTNCSGIYDKYGLAAWLSTMAFAESADMEAIQALAAFYRIRTLTAIIPPSASVFELSQGHEWDGATIRNIIQECSRGFEHSSEAKLPKQRLETNKQHQTRLKGLFRDHKEDSIQALRSALQRQWPCVTPSCPVLAGVNNYIDTSTAMSRIAGKFKTWYQNGELLEYLRQVSVVMAQQEVVGVTPPHYFAIAPFSRLTMDDRDKTFKVSGIFATNSSNVSKQSSLCKPLEPRFPIEEQYTSEENGEMEFRLDELCRRLQNCAKSKCEQDYVDVLRASCTSLGENTRKTFKKSSAWCDAHVQDLLRKHLDTCEKQFEKLNKELLHAAIHNGSLSDLLGSNTQYSPRFSPTFWLSQLHRDNFAVLSESWKTAIIQYGLAITHLHRAKRLIALSGQPADLIEEIGHVGHSNWCPTDFPETLLLEAESGILLRKEQEFIASHMRNPIGWGNIVLQLLMGGGKSSTIVPAVAAFLTDKENLVRIIVAKPQSKQMLQMLIAKLGYLLNRRVYHMPFSRALRPDASQAALIREIYEECIANRGVLLVQPEHILSFKLMAVESALAGAACAKDLLDTQKFFENVSRDIVDESDENFSVKFELIYTMGSQRPMELAPERWHLIQVIVGLIPRFAAQVKQTLPEAIEIQGDGDGKFPRVRIHRNDAADMLLMLLAKHIVEYGIFGLPTSSQPPEVQASLLRYISESTLEQRDMEIVETSRFWTTTTESPLLLVRGLIAGGIIRFALSTKRWRVNFGLDADRLPKTPLAVPFRSKDNPSPRSEFSHPDVLILLTLLSYYYGGLTNEQLFDSFTHLQDSDQAIVQYDEWVSTASSVLPPAFQHLSGIAIKDRHQCMTEIFPHLRYSKKAIDYYLSSMVFPKAMKEFPQKLSASGWDIGAIKRRPLTGFSGTNDTLHLLPLPVRHLHLPSQSHTNALVLQYLLRDENSVEILPQRRAGTDAEYVLSSIVKMQPEVRVLLDCGASILEQSNRQVAETWLRMRNEVVEAVVYFDDETLSVLDRAGHVESLQTSPFAKQLDVCLVYLDEAHTRGTDLKLPRSYRAGVTLGPALTKDKLTQGCMRMRKLGFGQSVVFVLPVEISIKIRERTCKTSNAVIRVADVLLWAIKETWKDLKRSMPLWAIQGERFERTKNLLCGSASPTEHLRTFLEDEAQSLKIRYKPQSPEGSHTETLRGWDMSNDNIATIVKRCQDFDAIGFGVATLSEEQERELAPEIEEERQIERPPRLDPASHRIHPDLLRLVRTGEITPYTEAIIPAFRALASTSAAEVFNIADLPSDLLVTSDFMRTVKHPTSSLVGSFISDSYQRPTQFVLSVPNLFRPRSTRKLIVISPYEANKLLGVIIKEERVTLHLFSPRYNATYAPLDNLELYNVGCDFTAGQVSRSVTLQLNLFAGSLYLRSFDEYNEICDFLGLLRSKPSDSQEVFADGFINPPTGRWGLQSSPVPFLRILLMKIRREGEGVEKTHMGKILNGIRLERGDIEDIL